MYKGTLIDDLIAKAERAETSFRLDQEQESKLAYWYAVAQNELANLDVLNHDVLHHDFLNHDVLNHHVMSHDLAGVA
jgi:hypothetical protein